MAIKLNGSTSGSVALDAPADTSPSGTDVTLTLPTSAGSSGQYLQTNGTGTLSWQTVTSGATWSESTASSLSGASQEWTGIPSDARQIIITHHGWSNASSSQHWCQIGDSGGFETTGYYTSNFYAGSSTAGGGNFANQSAFIQGQATDPATETTGLITITRLNSSNQWVVQWFYSVNNGNVYGTVGNKQLSGTLDRVRILPSTGNLDAGRANLMYLS